jgi:L-alanine-DL-glutamate epimerase-like enolase superfamily enzyme
MKITGITTRLLEIDPTPRYGGQPIPVGRPRRWLFPLVLIHTTDGIDGYSMGYGPHGDGSSITHNLHEVYAAEIFGEDPCCTERLWHKLMRKGRHLYNLTDTLVSVLDVAFWDIKGKAAGASVCALLGGERDSIATYATGWQFLPSPLQVHDESKRMQTMGYRAYKLQLWQGTEQDIPRLRAAREAVGEKFALMQDANSGYQLLEALEVGRVLDELNYMWFEEPVSDRNLAHLEVLARSLRTPILPGETLRWTETAETLRRGSFCMLRGDVHLKAGITGLRKLFAACETLGLELEVHTAATPLLDVANLHVACAHANCRFMEHHHPIFRFGMKNSQLEMDADGLMHVSASPGLGVELDWDWIDDHTVEQRTTQL